MEGEGVPPPGSPADSEILRMLQTPAKGFSGAFLFRAERLGKKSRDLLEEAWPKLKRKNNSCSTKHCERERERQRHRERDRERERERKRERWGGGEAVGRHWGRGGALGGGVERIGRAAGRERGCTSCVLRGVG